jgi:phage tail-like protein
MALPELDTSVGHSFGLEIDGVMIKAIQEVSGLKMEQDVIELKHNTSDGKYINKKLPGRPKSGEITLTRGLTADNSFEKWIKAAHLGQMGEARKGGAIIVFDFEGAALKRYKLTNCWPKTLELGAMKAGDTNLLTEKLTITYEALEPEG